jgi:hypothetical protein
MAVIMQISFVENVIEVIKNVNNIVGQLNDGIFSAIGVNIVTYGSMAFKNVFDLSNSLILIGTIAFGFYFVKNKIISAIEYLFRNF